MVVVKVDVQDGLSRGELEHVVEADDEDHHDPDRDAAGQRVPRDVAAEEAAVELLPPRPKVVLRRLGVEPAVVAHLVDVVARRVSDHVEKGHRPDGEEREVDRRLADAPPFEKVERQPNRQRREEEHPRVLPRAKVVFQVIRFEGLRVRDRAGHLYGGLENLPADAREEAADDVGRHEAHDACEAEESERRKGDADQEAGDHHRDEDGRYRVGLVDRVGSHDDAHRLGHEDRGVDVGSGHDGLAAREARERDVADERRQRVHANP
mmetsp:Transcript_39080/g.85893  ORF Transcript_39080/g.85893 Transcript_39080/m.85893 type:complete len:265 (+) Transcript_39080:796-1590(+)